MELETQNGNANGNYSKSKRKIWETHKFSSNLNSNPNFGIQKPTKQKEKTPINS